MGLHQTSPQPSLIYPCILIFTITPLFPNNPPQVIPYSRFIPIQPGKNNPVYRLINNRLRPTALLPYNLLVLSPLTTISSILIIPINNGHYHPPILSIPMPYIQHYPYHPHNNLLLPIPPIAYISPITHNIIPKPLYRPIFTNGTTPVLPTTTPLYSFITVNIQPLYLPLVSITIRRLA